MALALLLGAAPATAQLPERGDGVIPPAPPSWTTWWSPLRPLADLVRTLPQAPAMLHLLDAPPAGIGLLWSAGSPAGLPDVRDGRLAFEAAGTDAGGAYRRPLDPTDVQALSLGGFGWGPIGGRGSVIGRAGVGAASIAAAPFAALALPYRSDPFVPTDTMVPDVRRVAARLEGAIGGRFGGWTAGIAVGALTTKDHTAASPTPRLGRRTVPGVVAGIAHALPFTNIRLAVTGRWLGGAETVLLVGQPQPGLVYALDGYSEPEPVAISREAPYLHRVNRSAWSGGLAAEGGLWGTRWTLFAERARRSDAHVLARRFDAPIDRWHATGWTLGAALQRPLDGKRVLVTAAAGWDHLTGNATRNDLPGDIYRADEQALDLRADVRWTPHRSRWRTGVVLAIRREHRTERDFLVPIASDLRTWTPAAAVEVAYVGTRTSVGLGYSVSGYAAVASLPDPTAMGPVFVRVSAPALQLDARRAVPMAATITVRRRVGGTTALLFAARGYRVTPAGRQPALALAPGGERIAGEVTLGVILGEGQ
jgi:hypothetical protein